MSIQEHLNKIRNAIYGSEVRESIAKGIETAYDDASENGNANMEVKIARGTHPNLRSRLEEVDNKQQQTTAQLAQTEQKKLDRNENESITSAMLSPEIKQALNDGEWNVNINTSDIESGAITSEKFNDEVGLFEHVIPEFIIGATSQSNGDFIGSTTTITTKDFVPFNAGDTLTLVGGADGYRMSVVFFTKDNSFKESEWKNRTASDYVIKAQEDGFIKINLHYVPFVEINEENIPPLLSLIVLKINKLKRLGTNATGGKTTLTIELPLEAHGIDNQTGTAIGTNDLLITDDFTNTWRTGKYLRVIPGTNINLSFSTGKAYVFEYDSNFNYLGSAEIPSGQDYTLGDTSLIKIMLDENSSPAVDLTYDVVGNEPEWVFNDFRPNRGHEDINNYSFIYETATNEGRSILAPSLDDKQFTTTRYFNTGILKLPPNYDPYGDPVKLIIYAQGSSGYLAFNTGYIALGEESNLNYLADEGFAVMDVYRKTTKYGAETANGSKQYASLTSISALVSAYNYVINNFNISRGGVFVSGISAGGYDAGNLSYNMGIPVIATGLLSPTFNPLHTPYGSHEDVRLMVADEFGFEGDHSVLADQDHTPVPRKTPELREYMVNNAEKMIGYNPWWNGMIGEDVKEMAGQAYDGTIFDYELNKNKNKIYPNPIKIWYADDDDRANIPVQIPLFAKMIRNTQGNIELRVMPNGTGGHGSVGNDENSIKVPKVITKTGIEHANVPLAYVELVQYFRRFGG